MIDATDTLPLVRQCQILDLSRSSLYYRPAPPSAEKLQLMRRMDELHLEFPFYGGRKLLAVLRREGFQVGRRRVQTLMREMGIEALYQKPNLSRPDQAHKKWPYLLRDLAIARPNQVWCTDITYIPLAKGFAYLVAVMDWHSRKVLAWRLSNTMEAEFCVEALAEALHRHGRPEIFNTDQGSQFTSDEFTRVLLDSGVRISMDGKGRWMDNVFIERLWRSLKYEEVYLKAYDSIPDARRQIGAYFEMYNRRRPHQALDNRTPDEAFYGREELQLAA
jgi:putative transposase